MPMPDAKSLRANYLRHFDVVGYAISADVVAWWNWGNSFDERSTPEVDNNPRNTRPDCGSKDSKEKPPNPNQLPTD
jgi:hypothetical protein